MFKNYYALAKPGIIFGNALTCIAGFMMASRGHISWGLLLAVVVGLSLIIGSACVFNNCLDRDMDAKMDRTKKRALVLGLISLKNAVFFGVGLLIAGAWLLALTTNALTLIAALTGFFMYVVVYTFSKRKTSYGTVIGSISGAMPPLVGYLAVSNHLDSGALIIFLIICLWQMPHFYAIALFRLNDYESASIPVLPAVKGVKRTKVHMLLYTIAFAIAAMMPTFAGYTGYWYLGVVGLLSLVWLGLCVKGFWAQDDKRWARGVFFFSLVVVMGLAVMIPLDIVRG